MGFPYCIHSSSLFSSTALFTIFSYQKFSWSKINTLFSVPVFSKDLVLIRVFEATVNQISRLNKRNHSEVHDPTVFR